MGQGLPILCYRGTHRKLERAKWIDRLCYETIQDMPLDYDTETDSNSFGQVKWILGYLKS